VKEHHGDTLDLGKNAVGLGAPVQWVVFIGSSGCGKSTLIRQLKYAYDGCDIEEAMRFVREVHKVALSLLKLVLGTALMSLSDEMKIMAEKLLGLKRRAMITVEIAQNVRVLWRCPEVLVAEEQVADLQARQACRYFADRIDALAEEQYVPDPLDLLHVSIPSVGQQETRVNAFPGGELNLIEVSFIAGRNPLSANEASFEGMQKLFGAGLRAIVFVSSLLDSLANSDLHGATANLSDLSSSAVPPLQHLGNDLNMWLEAQTVARAQGIPCILLLSKRDLLDHSMLPPGANPVSFEAAVRASFMSAEPSSPARTSMHVPVDALCLDLLDTDNGITPFLDIMISRAFPHLEADEDVATSFGDAVHVCLCFFGETDQTIMCKRGAPPTVRWRGGVLNLDDHAWLNEMPMPLPNPLLPLPTATAERLGKDSPVPSRALFWNAICSLSEQLGGVEPPHLGWLHPVPLLTSTGALLVVFRQDVSELPSLVSRGRGLRCRPISQVASRLLKVAQATELTTWRNDCRMRSYAADVRAMLAATPTRELHPSVWLNNLRAASSNNALTTLRKGTYVTVMYTQSTRDGIQILLPDHNDAQMPPYVKISNDHLSAEDWSHLCDLGEAAKGDAALTFLQKDWSAARNWMGPEVSSEQHFTTMQKFFFGVLGLRQCLELKCNATEDLLRYSRVTGAAESLAVLGKLYTREIILADQAGDIQLIAVCQHFNIVNEAPTFPPALRWLPVRIFEARHFNYFVPGAVAQMSAGHALVRKGMVMQEQLAIRELRESEQVDGVTTHSSQLLTLCSGIRGSGLRVSDLRGSGMSHLRYSTDDHDHILKILRRTQPTLAAFSHEDTHSINQAWDRMRWTKRIVYDMCTNGLSIASTSPTARTLAESASSAVQHTFQPPRQRLQRHSGAWQESISALQHCCEQLRTKVDQIDNEMRAHATDK
jgi:hypothetical protein